MKVALHLTRSCNLRCTYCYAGEKTSQSMTEETARKAVDFVLSSAAAAGEKRASFTFFGGEPLLEFKLIEKIVPHALEKAGARGIKARFAVNTNGTILTDSIARFLVKNRFHVFLSIDGIEEAHDAARVFPNSKGCFFAVEKNLDSYRKLNPYVVTLSVITPDNVKHLADSAAFLTDRSVRFIMFTPDYSGDWDKKSFSELKKQYKKLARFYMKLHRWGKKVLINLFDDRIRSHVRGGGGRPKNMCNLAENEFSIAPDGAVFPCVQFVGDGAHASEDFVIGSVDEGWYDDKRAKVIRLAAGPSESCKGCALNGRCVNYCGCVNYRTTGKLNDVSPFLCEHEKMLFPIVDDAGNKLFKEKNELFLQKFYNPNFSVLSAIEECIP